MLVMSLKSPENIQLVLDSMINIFQDLLTRYFYCSAIIYDSLFTYSDILCCKVFHLNGSNCCCHKTPECLPTHQIDYFFLMTSLTYNCNFETPAEPKMASFVNLPPVWLWTSFLQHGNTYQNFLWSKQQSWFKKLFTKLEIIQCVFLFFKFRSTSCHLLMMLKGFECLTFLTAMWHWTFRQPCYWTWMVPRAMLNAKLSHPVVVKMIASLPLSVKVSIRFLTRHFSCMKFYIIPQEKVEHPFILS